MNLSLVLICVACSSAAQILVKLAGRLESDSPLWAIQMAGALASYGVSFAMYAVLLRRVDVSLAAPILAVGTVVTVVAAGWFLGEPITARRLTGVALAAAALFVLVASKPARVRTLGAGEQGISVHR
jgi:small multidrug resistance pump